MSTPLCLNVKGEKLLFKEPTLKEWNICVNMSKVDENAANLEFIKECCISHDKKALQAIFEVKPLAINKAFSLLWKAMNDEISEGNVDSTASATT